VMFGHKVWAELARLLRSLRRVRSVQREKFEKR
jgi:hypothetical protein